MKKLASIMMVAAFMAVFVPMAISALDSDVAQAVECVHLPYVIATNGLTANVMQDGSISLYYTDFLAQAIGFAPGRGAGCSVIWYGFADDAGKVTQGPTTQLGLEFTCADVNQPRQIEIAACSEAGCDFAITFVQIQDQMGVCEGVTPAPTVPPFPVMFTVPWTPTPTPTPTPVPLSVCAQNALAALGVTAAQLPAAAIATLEGACAGSGGSTQQTVPANGTNSGGVKLTVGDVFVLGTNAIQNGATQTSVEGDNSTVLFLGAGSQIKGSIKNVGTIYVTGPGVSVSGSLTGIGTLYYLPGAAPISVGGTFSVGAIIQ